MLRLLLLPIINAVLAVLAVLSLPARWFRSRKAPGYVQFKLEGDPPYRPTRRRRWMGPRVDPAAVKSVHGLGEQLRLIARDPKVKGVVLVIRDLTASFAKRQAIAELLETFKASKKEVVAYGITAGNAEYELMCSADRILLSPAGQVSIIGVAAEVTALADGLERVGVGAHFVRRGAYKTAPELFTHRSISDIQRQTVETFLDERYEALIASLVKGRKLSKEDARAKVDAGLFSSRRALTEGLCDALVSEADFETFFGTPVADFDDYEASRRVPRVRWRKFRRAPRLGIVPVNGMIVDGEGGGFPGGPHVAGAESIVAALQAAVDNRRTRAIVLYINSPGGSATGSELLLEEVKRASKKKPVIAFFDRVAASGGYMAALGAKEMWSAPQAVVGSIGVFAGKFEVQSLLEKLGIHRTVILRGQNAGLFSLARPFSESERAALERSVDDAYQSFLDLVADARKKTRDEIHARAEGRVYSGSRALAEGLVDRVGTFEEACRRALDLAERPSKDFEPWVYRRVPRRWPLPGLGVLSRARVYALWFPWLDLPDMGSSDVP